MTLPHVIGTSVRFVWTPDSTRGPSYHPRGRSGSTSLPGESAGPARRLARADEEDVDFDFDATVGCASSSSSSSLPPLVMPMDRMPSSMRAMYSSLALCDVAAECFGLSSRRERGVGW